MARKQCFDLGNEGYLPRKYCWRWEYVGNMSQSADSWSWMVSYVVLKMALSRVPGLASQLTLRPPEYGLFPGRWKLLHFAQRRERTVFLVGDVRFVPYL